MYTGIVILSNQMFSLYFQCLFHPLYLCCIRQQRGKYKSDRFYFAFTITRIQKFYSFVFFQLVKPNDEEYEQFWVDFNTGTKRITLFCEQSSNSEVCAIVLRIGAYSWILSTACMYMYVNKCVHFVCLNILLYSTIYLLIYCTLDILFERIFSFFRMIVTSGKLFL